MPSSQAFNASTSSVPLTRGQAAAGSSTPSAREEMLHRVRNALNVNIQLLCLTKLGYLVKEEADSICSEKSRQILRGWRWWNERSNDRDNNTGIFIKKVCSILKIPYSQTAPEKSCGASKGRGAEDKKEQENVHQQEEAAAFPSFLTSLDDGVSAIAFYRSHKQRDKVQVNVNEHFASTFFNEKEYGTILEESLLPELIYTSLIADEDKENFFTTLWKQLFAQKDKQSQLCVVAKFIDRHNKYFIGVCRLRMFVEGEGDELCGVISVYPLPSSKYVTASERSFDKVDTTFTSGLVVYGQPTQHPSHHQPSSSSSSSSFSSSSQHPQASSSAAAAGQHAYRFLDYSNMKKDILSTTTSSSISSSKAQQQQQQQQQQKQQARGEESHQGTTAAGSSAATLAQVVGSGGSGKTDEGEGGLKGEGDSSSCPCRSDSDHEDLGGASGRRDGEESQNQRGRRSRGGGEGEEEGDSPAKRHHGR